MNLKHLKDRDLLSQTKQLVQRERQVLTQILHHLKEVEKRKLFSDLGYQSLFEYAVKELKYSEGQAGRRIQAMRLINEIPELEKKIETGALSLSNVSQAQSYFRESTKAQPGKRLNVTDKLKVLENLENKSVREGQKLLIQMQPQSALPKERERVLTETHTEMRFVLTEEVKHRLQELRSLLGAKGANMSLAELIDYMAQVSIHHLKVKRFGKKRVEPKKSEMTQMAEKTEMTETAQASQAPEDIRLKKRLKPAKNDRVWTTPTTQELQRGKNPRYVSKEVQHQVWIRSCGKCSLCGSHRNLNIDHVKPVGLGGTSSPENLRLLCFNCNQRQAMKVFGVDHIRRKQVRSKRQLSL